jgi:uncharacterized protein
MELSNEFTVDVPVDEAWSVLTDLERIAPCMPGAALEEIEGDEYRGIVKVKVGPVTAQYRGKATFLERDPSAHKAVLRAEGRETRGQGNASATISATLEPSGSGTRVSVVTDLSITGRVAQIGRGVLADVSNKLLGQFVDSLESTVLAGAPGRTEHAAGESGAVVTGTPVREAASPTRRKRATKTASGGVSASSGSAADATADADAVLGPVAEPVADAQTEAAAERSPVRAADVVRGNGAHGGEGGGTARPAPDSEVEPVDLLELAGPSLAVRVVVPIAIVVVLIALWRRRRRRRRD